MDHVNPVKQLREGLFKPRRQAVQNGKTSEVVRLQLEIETLDRVIADEEARAAALQDMATNDEGGTAPASFIPCYVQSRQADATGSGKSSSNPASASVSSIFISVSATSAMISAVCGLPDE